MNTCPTQPARILYMPILVVYCAKDLVHMTAREFAGHRCDQAQGGHLLFADASNPRFAVTELLDRRGYLHRVSPVAKRRAFLSCFARVWDFTKMECILQTMGPMKIAELQVEAKNWNNEAGRKMWRFLAEQSPECIFDEPMFRQAWEATYIRLPESEWGKVFELRNS